MTRHSYEKFVFSFNVRADGDVPAVNLVRRILKHLLRAWGVKCTGYSEDKRMLELKAENEQLRKIIADTTGKKEETAE